MFFPLSKARFNTSAPSANLCAEGFRCDEMSRRLNLPLSDIELAELEAQFMFDVGAEDTLAV